MRNICFELVFKISNTEESNGTASDNESEESTDTSTNADIAEAKIVDGIITILYAFARLYFSSCAGQFQVREFIQTETHVNIFDV